MTNVVHEDEPQKKSYDQLEEEEEENEVLELEKEFGGGSRVGWGPVYAVVVESGTLWGQLFDLSLLLLISLSVVVAILDSVESFQKEYGGGFFVMEIVFTVIFTLECLLRLVCIQRPRDYLCSLMALVDVTSIVPTYLAFAFPSARPLVHLAVLRVFRILRVFRVLKMVRFMEEAEILNQNISANKRRIVVFIFTVFTMILVIGCAMYLIEGEEHGFSSIPVTLYWTVVTLTTVGYGDIIPQTVPGRALATFVMLSGYGIIACPLVLANTEGDATDTTTIACSHCMRKGHQKDANFCRLCGVSLLQKKLKTNKPKTKTKSFTTRNFQRFNIKRSNSKANKPEVVAQKVETENLLFPPTIAENSI